MLRFFFLNKLGPPSRPPAVENPAVENPAVENPAIENEGRMLRTNCESLSLAALEGFPP